MQEITLLFISIIQSCKYLTYKHQPAHHARDASQVTLLFISIIQSCKYLTYKHQPAHHARDTMPTMTELWRRRASNILQYNLSI